MKKTDFKLVPNTPSTTPDYYCTWQTQLYATNDGKPPAQRAIIGEKALFDKKKPYGWAYFYEKARKDLFLVMDDSWDVPLSGDASYYGSLILNKEKFPRSNENAETPAEALKNLSDRIKALGWKGLGGWICAQKSELLADGKTEKEYWEMRLKEANESDFRYWKVDWGNNAADPGFRKMLTDAAHEIAPNLTVEHAVTNEVIPYSDAFRSYDVPAIMSIPMTLEKLRELLPMGKAENGYAGLINCEDEAYIAAAGGFSMGIMRHPYSGNFVNGKKDMSFPEIHRSLKTKMYEVIRAARWHRIAPAFGIDGENTIIDNNELTDTWRLLNADEELEAWWLDVKSIKDFTVNGIITKTAPARISRGAALPDVTPDKNGLVPYLIASQNPNGVFSVAALGRTVERDYFIPHCDISVNVNKSDTIGVFGEYGSLILENTKENIKTVLIQDLADDYAFDITENVKIYDGKIIIPGELITRAGTHAQPETDTSEPGAVICLK